MIGIAVAIYLIIGLFLALYTYTIAPCSLTDALIMIFFWPFILMLVCSVFGGKKKEEDCGC